jgi:ATP-binding protein involved in chromosome partitioning
MPLDKNLITEALRTVPDPGGGLDLITSGRLRHAAVTEGLVALRLSPPDSADREAMDRLARAVHRAIAARCAAADFTALTVEFVGPRGLVHTATVRGGGETVHPAPHPPPPSPMPQGHRPISGLTAAPGHTLPGIKRIIAVGAGKGGVGKSSIAVNLAVGLARRGHAAGLLDADIYGPSMPTMLGLQALEQAVHAGMLQPFLVHGIKAITLGKLVEAEKPLIWRGPMAHGAFKQLAEQTQWGELDDLIIDLPPGTGDVSLTMAQMLSLTGAVIVCTPQRVAQDDAVRAARMFQQLGIEVLGVVENMSFFVGDDGKEYDLFGKGGAEKMAARLGVPFLGAVPITTALRQNSDNGSPTANFAKGTALAAALEAMVTNVEAQASLAAVRQGTARPTLSVR